MTIGGSLITGAGTLLAGLKKGKRDGQAEERAHTAEIVRGLDKAVDAGLIKDMERFGEIMDRKQSITTKAIVDRIQGKAA